MCSVSQPVLKTTVQMATIQKRMHCPSSSKFQSVISSQEKEVLVTSSLSKCIAPKSSKQPSEGVSSGHELATSEPDILIRREPVRRKSFTSLLMTRPKVCFQSFSFNAYECIFFLRHFNLVKSCNFSSNWKSKLGMQSKSLCQISTITLTILMFLNMLMISINIIGLWR